MKGEMRGIHLLLICILLSSSFTSHAHQRSSETYIDGDKLIDNDTVWSNEHIILTGNLSIDNSSTLTLESTVLTINSSYAYHFKIKINNNSKIVLKNSSIVKCTYFYEIFASNSTIIGNDSTIINATINMSNSKMDCKKMFFISTSFNLTLTNVSAKNSTFESEKNWNFTLSGSRLNLTFCKINMGKIKSYHSRFNITHTNFTNSTIFTHESGMDIDNSSFIHTGDDVVIAMNSSINITNSKYINSSGYILNLTRCNVLCKSTVFLNNSMGFRLLYSTILTLKDCNYTPSENSKDYYLTYGSYLKMYDTTYKFNSGTIADFQSSISVFWSLTVRAMTLDLKSAEPDTSITIKDKNDRVAHFGITDSNGTTGPTTIIDYERLRTTTRYYNPYKVIAKKYGGENATSISVKKKMTVIIGIDSEPPRITIEYPVNNSAMNTSLVLIRGNSSDNQRVKKVEISLDGYEWVEANAEDAEWHQWRYIANCEDGNNIIYVRAIDIANLVCETYVSFLIDTKKPLIEITSPKDGTITNNFFVIVKGKTEKQSHAYIDKKYYYAKDGEFEFNVTLEKEGINVIKVVVFDVANNKDSAEISVTRDTTPPFIEITYPVGYLETNKTEIEIKGMSEPNATIECQDNKIYADEYGEFALHVKLNEGQNRIWICATDVAGNKNQTTIVIGVDTLPPEIYLNPLPNLTKDDSITVSGKITENVNEVYINSISCAVEDGTFSMRIKLSEGENIIEVKAEDKHHNWNSTTVKIVRDSQGPEIKIDEPKKKIVNERKITFKGTSSDPSGVEKVYIGTLGGAMVECKGTTSWHRTLELEEGTHTIRVKAIDTLGNDRTISMIITVKLPLVDKTPPQLNIRTPRMGEIIYENPVRVSGTASDVSGIDYVEISIDGVNWLRCTGNESWYIDVDLPTGENKIWVRSYDKYGNMAQINVTVEFQAEKGAKFEFKKEYIYIIGGILSLIIVAYGVVVAYRKIRGVKMSPPMEEIEYYVEHESFEPEMGDKD